MADFEEKWTKQTKEPIVDKVKDAIRPQTGLRNNIDGAQQAIKTLITRIDGKVQRLRDQDSKLFRQVVSAQQKHDTERAIAYSNELAEVRKISRSVTQVKLVLEQINLRMGTVQDFGDVVTTISPIIPVVRGMKGSLNGIMPQAGSEMNEIGNMLNSLITDAGQLGGGFTNTIASSDEADSILAEATAVADVEDQDKFPELPSTPITTSTPIPTTEDETEQTEDPFSFFNPNP